MGEGPAGTWLEVTVAAPEGIPAELASEYLIEEAGAHGVEERDPLACGRAVLVAHIPSGRLPLDAAPLAALGCAVISARRVPDRDWEAFWRAGLAPVLLGERLAVVPPSAAEQAAPAGRIAVRIDPGSAFGSGLHPTTALSAEALERALAVRPAPAAVLDVGTGSGILAIAARLLGARPAVAIDDDPESVREARRNAALNGCAEAFEASDRALEAIEERFDLVVANLDAATLAAIGASLGPRVAPGGELIVSGLRAEERWPGPGSPLVLRETIARGGWRCERWGY